MRVIPTILCALWVAFPLSGQTTWTSYLQGETREATESAVQTLEEHWADRPQQRRARYEQLQRLYVDAREEELTLSEYTDELVQAGLVSPSPEPADRPAEPPEDPIEQARSRIAETFRRDVPLPGTRSFSAAARWLRGLADREGFPVARLETAVASLGSDVLASLESSDSERFLDTLPIARDSLPGDLPPGDRAQELVAMWELRVLAASDEERIELIGEMLGAIERVDQRKADDVRASFSLIREERRELEALRDLLPLSAQAFALVSPYTLGDSPRGGSPQLAGRQDAVQELFALLVRFSETESDAGVDLYEQNAEIAFLVDLVEALLGGMSDLQRFSLAGAAGLEPHEIRDVRIELHHVRDRAARLFDEPAAPGLPPVSDDSAFAESLAEGADIVDDAKPWAAGERSRSGDVYRWAMLSIMSHPYAQYLLATVPELADTRTMVETFAAQIYEEALRAREVRDLAVEPLVIGDAIQPLQRVYRVEHREAASALYESFAVAGQGVPELSRDFATPYTSDLTVAGYWSHSHGLHLVVSRPQEVEEAVQARVDDWFALAAVASLDTEEISLTFRGLAALRRAVLDELEPVVAASGIVSLGHYAPRLPVALSILETAVSFEADPLDVTHAIADLYGAARDDDVIAPVVSELARVVERLRGVEIPDRRILGQLAVPKEASE